MAHGGPLFCDITWKVGADNRPEHSTSSLAITSTVIDYCGLDTMMHLTCVGQTKGQIIETLNKAKDLGIRNILALRGGEQIISEEMNTLFNCELEILKPNKRWIK